MYKMEFYPAWDDKAKQFPSSQMLLPRRHCCVLCLHFKNLFGQNGVWKCWNEKFSNLTPRFERCFFLQMFRYLFWSSNKLWKKTEKGSLFFVRIWLLYSWKDVPERMENCKQYIIFLYRSSDDSYYGWGVKFALQATGLFFGASKCIIPWSICGNYSLQMVGVVTVHAFLVVEQSPFCHI